MTEPHQELDGVRVFHACTSSYVVFATMFGGLTVLGAVALATSFQLSNWPIVGVPALVLAGFIFWLSRFELVITPTVIRYRSLFGTAEMTRDEIVVADFAQTTGPLETPFTFVLRSRFGNELRINAKVFSLEAVDALRNVVPQSRK